MKNDEKGTKTLLQSKNLENDVKKKVIKIQINLTQFFINFL